MLATSSSHRKGVKSNTRLARDVYELFKHPVPRVSVSLRRDDGDLRSLCAILSPSDGPYAQMSLHLKIDIPVAYPKEPPTVSIDPPEFRHPNVFDGWICLDLLEGTVKGHSYVGGYTPAYTLSSILIQLLSFFSSEIVEQNSGKKSKVTPRTDESRDAFRRRAIGELQRVKCLCCGYDGSRAFDELRDLAAVPVIDIPAQIPDLVSESGSQHTVPPISTLDGIPEIWIAITELLNDKDVIRLGLAYTPIQDICSVNQILARRDMICFYLRKPFDPKEPESILGIGVNITSRSRRSSFIPDDASSSSSSSTSSQQIPIPPSEFDLLSFSAYKNHSIRTSIWGVPFTHFLPIFINKRHFDSALPIILSSLNDMVGKKKSKSFECDIVLKVLPRLMNDVVVCFSKTVGKDSVAILHASEKALNGYLALHELFVALTSHYPSLQTAVNRILTAFVNDPVQRTKHHVPNLGHILILLTLPGSLAWRSMAKPFIVEMLTRNVVFCLDVKHGNTPHLAHLRDANELEVDARLIDTFKCSSTSLRLLMFQVLFLRLLPQASKPDVSALSVGAKDILAITSWPDFLKWVLKDTGAAGPSKAEFAAVLREAVGRSEQLCYHALPRGFSSEIARRERMMGLNAKKGWNFFPVRRKGIRVIDGNG